MVGPTSFMELWTDGQIIKLYIRKLKDLVWNCCGVGKSQISAALSEDETAQCIYVAHSYYY